MKTIFAKKISEETAIVAVLFQDKAFDKNLELLNDETEGLIRAAINLNPNIYKKGETLKLFAKFQNSYRDIILLGGGDLKDYSAINYMNLGGKIHGLCNKFKVKSASILLSEIENKEEAIINIAYGLELKSFSFDKYKTKLKDEDKPSFTTSEFITNNENAEKDFQHKKAICEGVFFTRNLISEPPNVIYPESYANICANELKPLGVKVDILDEVEMKKLGMNALLGVAQGSKNKPRMVVLHYKNSENQPISFVGKGVTFDTGGISLKPSTGMADMKYDMAGSAVVVGLIKALALRGAKINVVGVLALVENMPGGGAQRPSDVVTSMSGQTIEVLDTDAEGRLILADALWYCQDKFKPKFMVNLATLTGAITIALGSAYAGLFSNNDELADKLIKSGAETEEKLWRLPLGDVYDKLINSEIADLQNISSERGAGSITAAQFLQRFVNNTPWAHLDVAGVTWTKKELDLSPKGATAFGVRLLEKLVANYYEK